MAQMRFTMFFQIEDFGWSEHFHNLSNDINVVMSRGEDLIDERLKILPRSASITYARASDDEVFRDSRISDIDSRLQGTAAQVLDTSELASTCILARIEADPFIRRTWYIRPAPGGTADDSDRRDIPVNFLSQFVNVHAVLTAPANQWAIKGVNPLNVRIPILSFVTGPPPQLLLGAAHGLLPGATIRISGVQSTPSVNGIYKVLTVAQPDQMTLAPNLPLGTAVVNGTGFIRSQSKTLSQISRLLIVRVGKRDTGRPFDSPRGRRSRGS